MIFVVALLLAPVIHDALRRPSFRRLALRNIVRRPGEAALVVVGSLLGTAIITAAFIVGDTFDASIRDIANRELGPVDEVVTVEGLDGLGELEAAVAGVDAPDIDGKLTFVSSGAAIADTRSEDRRAEPFGSIGEVDFDAARSFGSDPSITGMEDAGATPSGDEAVITERLADELDVGVGDGVEIFAYGSSRTYEVRGVVAERGMAGYADVYVEPGTVASLASGSGAATAAPPSGQVLVSNSGGVFDGADATGTVVPRLEEAVAGIDGAEVQPVKQDLLDDAEAEGESIGQLFFGVGSFSVLVGILLLVNLFVMLAEERKSELGTLRAVGLKRNHLLRVFGLEGAAYSVVAAVAGGLVGIGVGWAITEVAAGIISGDDDSGGLEFVFSADRSSITAGITIGLAISMVTVWLTSSRIARLNVIRAIRDLPEPTTAESTRRGLVLGALGSIFGLAVLAAGVTGSTAVPTLAGLPLALLSAIPLLRRFLGRRLAVLGPAVLSLLWGLFVFQLLPEATESSGIEVFVVQGVVLVASGVLIASSTDHLWVGLVDRLARSGGGLAGRLALAYPLARRVRTGILLAMFSLIVFTMTFMSTFSGIFGAQDERIADDLRGSYDVFVDSNFANPATVEQLEAQPDVEAASGLLRGFPEFRTDWHPDPDHWPVSGFDASLLDGTTPNLSSRAGGYGSDRAVFEAVLADPSLAVATDFFLQENGGPPLARLHVGDSFEMINPVSGATRTLTVAGITDADWIGNGPLVAREPLREFLGARSVEARHYVRVAEGADPDVVAERLTGALLANGADAQTFQGLVGDELAEQQGFFRLMQGYLALGLMIGIAGLGVVMVRAVRERRRQVGMLRAMGFSAAVVRRAFLLEAGFIAVQGVVMGIALGLLTSYNVLTQSSTFGDQPLPFAVPWFALAVIFFAPLAAALLAAVTPAIQASRIRPAAALRIAD